MAKVLTQAEYAGRRGVTAQYINQLVKRGIIPVTADGKIDPRAADKVLAAKKERFKSGDSALLLKARAQFETARAQREEMRLARERGEYGPVSDMIERVEHDYLAVRNVLLSLPGKIAPRVPEDVRVRVYAELRTGIRQALFHLAARGKKSDATEADFAAAEAVEAEARDFQDITAGSRLVQAKQGTPEYRQCFREMLTARGLPIPGWSWLQEPPPPKRGTKATL